MLSRNHEWETFSDGHVDAAAELLAARHRRHRQAEPLLPARFEDPAAARSEVEAACRKAGASGAALLREGRLVGYLLGSPDDETRWGGPNVWFTRVPEPKAAEPEFAESAPAESVPAEPEVPAADTPAEPAPEEPDAAPAADEEG